MPINRSDYEMILASQNSGSGIGRGISQISSALGSVVKRKKDEAKTKLATKATDEKARIAKAKDDRSQYWHNIAVKEYEASRPLPGSNERADDTYGTGLKGGFSLEGPYTGSYSARVNSKKSKKGGKKKISLK